jgi:chorismate dehydratase
LSLIPVGELSFVSGWPIHGPLRRGLPGSEMLDITVGRPGELDDAVVAGRLAAAPVSSLEYLRRSEHYTLIPGLSISAWGRLGSATLFSDVPFSRLDGATVAVPPFGATSNALLRWLLQEMFGVRANFVEAEAPLAELLGSFPAALLIGDEAIQSHRLEQGAHRIDLGQSWWQITHTPLVTTVWVVAPGQPDDVVAFLIDLLGRAKTRGQELLSEFAAEAAEKLKMPSTEMEGYFSLLNFDFSSVHQQGLHRLKEALFFEA